jgi:mannose-6-phosphate isomerase-like protein (cupin superfamily)
VSAPTKINLSEKLASFDETWTPKIIGALNGQHVKLAKLEGDFVWHHHEKEDELFLVLSGELRLEFRDGVEVLREGELIIVPRGVEHLPIAQGQVAVLLFEPATTFHTGNVVEERTVESPEWI